MADLSPFPLTHFRSGRLRPLPDGSRGSPELDEEDVREFPIEARKEILERISGDEEEQAEPAPEDEARQLDPPAQKQGTASVDAPGILNGEGSGKDFFATAEATAGIAPRQPQPLPAGEPRAGPELEPPQAPDPPEPPTVPPGQQTNESRSEFPAKHAGDSERLSAVSDDLPADPRQNYPAPPSPEPSSSLDLTGLWAAFRTIGPPRPLELAEPQNQPAQAEAAPGSPPAEQWQPNERYRMLRRGRGVGLAVPQGTHPISIYGVEDGLVIEIEEQFLKQLQALRDFHLARKNDRSEARSQDQSAPAQQIATTENAQAAQ
jgi:hypothetical protein